ncbi:MAG: glycosyltransferase family 39 protein [Chloroflexales bacterium]|nr:glycosyltransferase family 39 protein [Chloroflexales bacterium]
MNGQPKNKTTARLHTGKAARTDQRLRLVSWLQIGAIFLLALALRLAVWRWREFYPLGGDEQEYFNQALTLLREWRYEELRLMRPPLYGFFLAGWIVLVDSSVQNLRLVQAVISAATVVPIWLLTREIGAWPLRFGLERERQVTHGAPVSSLTAPSQAPAVAALLCALSYTLAANATELLTETIFMFGLTVFFWLLLRTARMQQLAQPGWFYSALFAGLTLGALCLTRSVALPLLPLGTLWLLSIFTVRFVIVHWSKMPLRTKTQQRKVSLALGLRPLAGFALATLLVILPWTARNYLLYDGLILIDTTGAENLWLDNNPAGRGTGKSGDLSLLLDPAEQAGVKAPDPLLPNVFDGREAAKAQLYALGDQRVERQRLAMQQGIAVIVSDPQRFLMKAWGELQEFFALEYTDHMRARPAIWVSPGEVWARLLLGDGLWLLILVAGTLGIVRKTSDEWSAMRRDRSLRATRIALLATPAWLLGFWALYVVLTAMVFHVELRYRLPLYPILLPYAAFALVDDRRLAAGSERRQLTLRQTIYCSLLPIIVCALTLLHRPYPQMAWQLGWKHLHLARVEWALARSDAALTHTAAQAALQHDEGSALARVALARAALLAGDAATAEATLRSAIATIPAHPHAHLLLGDLLRQRSDDAAARDELAYERASLQDFQTWSWQRFTTPPQAGLDIGGGLDLGFIKGFHLSEANGWRWSHSVSQVRLATEQAPTIVQLRLASGRPVDSPPSSLEVLVGGESLGRFQIMPNWRDYSVPLPMELSTEEVGADGVVVVELRSDTFTPREFDRTSPDGRALGVMVDRIQIIDRRAMNDEQQTTLRQIQDSWNDGL